MVIIYLIYIIDIWEPRKKKNIKQYEKTIKSLKAELEKSKSTCDKLRTMSYEYTKKLEDMISELRAKNEMLKVENKALTDEKTHSSNSSNGTKSWMNVNQFRDTLRTKMGNTLSPLSKSNSSFNNFTTSSNGTESMVNVNNETNVKKKEKRNRRNRSIKVVN